MSGDRYHDDDGNEYDSWEDFCEARALHNTRGEVLGKDFRLERIDDIQQDDYDNSTAQFNATHYAPSKSIAYDVNQHATIITATPGGIGKPWLRGETQPGLKYASSNDVSGDRVTGAGMLAVLALVVVLMITCGVIFSPR